MKETRFFERPLRLSSRILKGSVAPKLPTPGMINWSALSTLSGSFVTMTFPPQMPDGLHHRGEISRAVIDDGNHKSPFVLGSMRPSWRSLEQATRKARANALNSASILW